MTQYKEGRRSGGAVVLVFFRALVFGVIFPPNRIL